MSNTLSFPFHLFYSPIQCGKLSRPTFSLHMSQIGFPKYLYLWKRMKMTDEGKDQAPCLYLLQSRTHIIFEIERTSSILLLPQRISFFTTFPFPCYYEWLTTVWADGKQIIPCIMKVRVSVFAPYWCKIYASVQQDTNHAFYFIFKVVKLIWNHRECTSICKYPNQRLQVFFLFPLNPV